MVGVIALTHKDTADHHWRVALPFARLAEAGIDAVIYRLQSDELPANLIAGRVVLLPRVVVQSDDPADSHAYVDRIRRAGALAVVFEIDDDELSPAAEERDRQLGDLTAMQLQQRAQGYQWVRNMVPAVDAVTVSTEPLAAVVRRYTSKPVIVVPNSIDIPWFRDRLVARPPWSDHVTIGWAGYRRPDADLEVMAVAWGRIAARYPDVRFVVAGYQADCIYREVDPERIYRVPWTNNLDEYPRAYQVDIGCCPLADTAFNRSKSPIKAWEYAVACAAVVATPTLYGGCAYGNALQAEGADEWELSLSLLIETAIFRSSAARMLLAHVMLEHGLSANLHHWASTYSEIAARVGAPV